MNNFTIDHKLRYITQLSDFPIWIRTLAEYLRLNDLTHFILTSATTPIILCTTNKDYSVTLFTHYITTTAYLGWFTQKLTQSYFTLALAITLALFKYGRAKTGYEFAHELFINTFHPDTEVYDFQLRTHYLKEQCSIHGITIDEHQITQSIISNLPSEYEQIRINYRCNPITATSNHILNYIAATQEQFINHTYTITPYSTLSTTYCPLYSKPSHSAFPSPSSTQVTQTHHREYNPSSNLDNYFIVDPGADISILNTEDYLHHPYYTNGYRLSMANSASIPITSKGRLHFKWANGLNPTLAALHSPRCSYNLLSGFDLHKAGIHLSFTQLCLTDSQGVYLCPVNIIGYNFCVSKHHLLPTTTYTIKTVQTQPKHSLQFVHEPFSHISIHYIKKSLLDKTIKGLTHDSIDSTDVNKFQCPVCMKGKTRKHPHIIGHCTKYQKDYAPFEYIHSDIFGPFPNLPPSTPKYFISFIDENTHFRWVYPLWSKDSATVTTFLYNFIQMLKT